MSEYAYTFSIKVHNMKFGENRSKTAFLITFVQGVQNDLLLFLLFIARKVLKQIKWNFENQE